MLAPAADSVVLPPVQIAVEVALTEILGMAVVETVTEAVLLIHNPLAPCTV